MSIGQLIAMGVSKKTSFILNLPAQCAQPNIPSPVWRFYDTKHRGQPDVANTWEYFHVPVTAYVPVGFTITQIDCLGWRDTVNDTVSFYIVGGDIDNAADHVYLWTDDIDVQDTIQTLSYTTDIVITSKKIVIITMMLRGVAAADDARFHGFRIHITGTW